MVTKEYVSMSLRALLESRGWTTGTLGRKTGIPKSTTEAIVAGKRPISLVNFFKLTHAFKMSSDELAKIIGFDEGGTEEPMVEIKQAITKLERLLPDPIPVYGEFVALPTKGMKPIDYVFPTKYSEPCKNIEAFIMDNNFMEPHICKGDLVFIQREVEGEYGDIMVGRTNGKTMVGRLKTKDGEKWLENAGQEEKVRIFIATAVVVACMRMYKTPKSDNHH